jgi:PKD repeat protein
MLQYHAVIRSFFLILEAAILLTLINSCTEKKDPPDYYTDTPIAGFSWSGNDGPAPVTVQFINTSLNADQFEWNFADGQVSSERDPQHTFYNSSKEPKNFNVVLKATDSPSGLFQRKSRVIVIQPQN